MDKNKDWKKVMEEKKVFLDCFTHKKFIFVEKIRRRTQKNQLRYKEFKRRDYLVRSWEG